MRSFVLSVACLAFIGNGLSPGSRSDPGEALANLLLSYSAPTGFVPSTLSGLGLKGAHSRVGNGARISSRPMVMCEGEEKPERRKDANDGGIYTMKEYQDYYGEDGWEEAWNNATPADDIKMISELKVGDVFEEATVMRYTDNAAFMDIGAETMAYMHYSRIPEDVWEYLDEGTTLKVAIEEIDMEKGQLRVTTGTPGEKVRTDIKSFDELKVGDVIENAVVKRYTDFGAFMDIKAEVDALCHVSKILPSVWETLDSGHEMKVTIESLDKVKGRVGVSAIEGSGRGKGKGRGAGRR
mmetsp:Transcript_113911/g.201023  ORF Transcript_113911/g.201023 Transcript_113911/m.201023 type:complete len:296 (-) Transcript_113911:132-1019(-)